MNEAFIKFLWKNRLYTLPLIADDGSEIEIIHPGFENTDAGPDFFSAKIKIADVIWSGNVEFHVNSSDWYKHSHDTDRAYDNVILHVVIHHDKPVFRTTGEQIPTVELKYPAEVFQAYLQLNKSPETVKCMKLLPPGEQVNIASFVEALAVERLEEKSKAFYNLYIQSGNDWDTAFFVLLARYFGMKVNSLPFEQLALSFPLKIIDRFGDDLFRTEALLFGQAGLLDRDFTEDYPQRLKKEYQYLKLRHQLRPIKASMWKFLRLRPANFPTVRIAQLAAVLSKNSRLFDDILHIRSLSKYREFFDVQVSEYWKTHYNFDKQSVRREKKIGNSAVDVLLINVVAVTLFTYGKYKSQQEYANRAIDLLEDIKAENNSAVAKYVFFRPVNAFQSQGLIQLYENYCKKGRCLNCRIGADLIIRLSQNDKKSSRDEH